MRLRYHYRKGFSLIEVAIAMAIAGSAMVWSYSVISNAITLQKKTADITNAVHLAKIKMAQIDAAARLESDTTKGDIPGYRGYRFETIIKEEEMNLLKMVTGDNQKKPEDLLGKQDTSMSDLLKKRGKSSGLETGGIIKVFRIKVTIFYPSGYGEDSFAVEGFKANKF